MSSNIIEDSNIDDLDNYFVSQQKLIEYSKILPDTYFLIYFTASWCGPCKQISPFFYEKKKEFKQNNKQFIFKKIDVDLDEFNELCDDLSITAMPTFIFFKNGLTINKIVGADKEALKELLNVYS